MGVAGSASVVTGCGVGTKIHSAGAFVMPSAAVSEPVAVNVPVRDSGRASWSTSWSMGSITVSVTPVVLVMATIPLMVEVFVTASVLVIAPESMLAASGSSRAGGVLVAGSPVGLGVGVAVNVAVTVEVGSAVGVMVGVIVGNVVGNVVGKTGSIPGRVEVAALGALAVCALERAHPAKGRMLNSKNTPISHGRLNRCGLLRVSIRDSVCVANLITALFAVAMPNALPQNAFHHDSR